MRLLVDDGMDDGGGRGGESVQRVLGARHCGGIRVISDVYKYVDGIRSVLRLQRLGEMNCDAEDDGLFAWVVESALRWGITIFFCGCYR